jgi:pimeloyl-ACP methyl ester carboxylesterase
MKLLFIGLFFFSFSAAQARITRSQKESWLAQLRACERDCGPLAAAMMRSFAKDDPEVKLSLKDQAQSTLLYLHSFTLGPSEMASFHGLPFYDRKLNFFAPIFTAHQSDSTPADYKNLRAEDLILDTELAFQLVSSLGKPVIIMGFSMGGMAAVHLGVKESEKIAKLILLAPAVMIARGGDDLACAGQNWIVQSLVKSFMLTSKAEAIEKYLNGACAVSKMIKTVRGRYQILPEVQNWEQAPNQNSYLERIEQLKFLAKDLRARTLVVSAPDDEVIERNALAIFSRNIRGAKMIDFSGSPYRIGHMNVIQNVPVPQSSRNLFDQIESFISEL